jgi:tRNA (cmo5U34)-methyltransferase
VRWLSRYAAYAIASGADPDKANGARAAVEKNLSLLSPEEDAQILREAGFRSVELFYAAFTWRGWIAYA